MPTTSGQHFVISRCAYTLAGHLANCFNEFELIGSIVRYLRAFAPADVADDALIAAVAAGVAACNESN